MIAGSFLFLSLTEDLLSAVYDVHLISTNRGHIVTNIEQKNGNSTGVTKESKKEWVPMGCVKVPHLSVV